MSTNDVFHKTFSGTDMVASIVFPGTKAITIGELTTISYSVYREKAPVRTCSYINVRGFTKGPRTVAGTMIFTVFDKHIVNRLRAEVPYFASLIKMKADEWPPFDIYITMGNEYGASAKLNIYGLTIVDEGQVMSVEDLFTENQWSFMARNIDLLDALGSEQNAPLTAMDHKEAVPSFKANELVLDDEFETMKKDLDKMKADAKKAVDDARAKAKEAFTASTTEFAKAKAPVDRYDSWAIGPEALKLLPGVDPSKEDYSKLSVEAKLANTKPIEWINNNNRMVAIKVAYKNWGEHHVPAGISVGVSVQRASSGDELVWKGITLDGSTKYAVFNVIGFHNCGIEPKIYIKISNKDFDVNGTTYYLQGEDWKPLSNNDGDFYSGEDSCEFIFLDSEDSAKAEELSDKSSFTLSIECDGVGSDSGKNAQVTQFYDDASLQASFGTHEFLMGKSFGCMRNFGWWSTPSDIDLNANYHIKIDGMSSDMSSSDMGNIHIKAPITCIVKLDNGEYCEIGGNEVNGNIEGVSSSFANWKSYFNQPFDMKLSDIKQRDFMSPISGIPYLNGRWFSGVKVVYDDLKKAKTSEHPKLSNIMVRIGYDPKLGTGFRAETEDGTKLDNVKFGTDTLSISLRGVAGLMGLEPYE